MGPPKKSGGTQKTGRLTPKPRISQKTRKTRFLDPISGPKNRPLIFKISQKPRKTQKLVFGIFCLFLFFVFFSEMMVHIVLVSCFFFEKQHSCSQPQQSLTKQCHKFNQVHQQTNDKEHFFINSTSMSCPDTVRRCAEPRAITILQTKSIISSRLKLREIHSGIRMGR